MTHEDIAEIVYARALEMVAIGETREDARLWLIDNYPQLSFIDIDAEMRAALKDALKQGVEREDIDPSWF